MTRGIMECALEPDVLQAIAFGRQDQALSDHVAQCATCAEVAEIARALHEDRTAAGREARVPAAGTVWWRATIRARADAARTAAQPIGMVQGLSGACAIGVACALVTVAWRSVQSFDRVSDVIVIHALPLVLGLAACLVIAPLALYFTLTDD